MLGGGGGGGFMMRMGGDGMWTSDPPALTCQVGRDFEAYMQRAAPEFPWDPTVPVTHEVDGVWCGRALRVLPEAGGEWVMARVVKLSRFNMGPFSAEIHYQVEVRYDDPVDAARMGASAEASEAGREFAGRTRQEMQDETERMPYRELQERLKDLDLPATGRTEVLRERLFEAWVRDAEVTWAEEDEQAEEQRLAAENRGRRGRSRSPSPSPSQPLTPPVLYRLVRADVDRGGCFRDEREGRRGCLLSFEWVDPAFPEFDIREGLSCPTCRAIEPPTAGDVPAEQLSAGECPVCLDSSDSCLTLQCGHRICQSCWKKWALADGGQQARETDDGEDEDEVPDGSELSPADLVRVRAEEQGVLDDALEEEGEIEVIADIINDAVDLVMSLAQDGTPASLRRVRRFLLVQPLVLCMNSVMRDAVMRHGSLGLVRTFIDVVPLRAEEITARGEQNEARRRADGVSEEDRENEPDLWVRNFCRRVGELYEAQSRYLTALPWYERCISYSTDGRFGAREEASDLSNRGVCEKRAGRLKDALASYDASLAVCDTFEIAASNRQTLIREMRHWTGTAVEYDVDDEAEDRIRANINENLSPWDRLGPGYYSEAQRDCLPRERELAAEAAERRSKPLYRLSQFCKDAAQRVHPEAPVYVPAGLSIVFVVLMIMCIVVRSVDVFMFQQFCPIRAILRIRAANWLLEKAHGPRQYSKLSLLVSWGEQGYTLEAAAKRALRDGRLAVFVLVVQIMVIVAHFFVPLFIQFYDWSVGQPLPHAVGVMANLTSMVLVCVALLLLVLRSPYQCRRGAHVAAAGAAAALFLIIKIQGDRLLAPALTCGVGDEQRACVAFVTGGNSGIGFALAQSLAEQGHHVVIGCRSHTRCDVAAASIEAAVPNSRVMARGGLELGSIGAVQSWVAKEREKDELPVMDLLFLNAGFTPSPDAKTAEGYEGGFGTMHLGHWAVVEAMADSSMLQPAPRIVVVSSDAMRMGSFDSSLMEGDGEGDLRGEFTVGCPVREPLSPPVVCG